MTLKKTRLTEVVSLVGPCTVGILTVGQTVTPVGIASTSFIKGIVMHNCGIGSIVSSLYFYPSSSDDPANVAHAHTAHRMARIDLVENETFFYEMNYPVTLAGSDRVVVELLPSVFGPTNGQVRVNFQIIGDTDIG